MIKLKKIALTLGLLVLGASMNAQAATFVSEPCNLSDITANTINSDVCVGSIEGNNNTGNAASTSTNLNTIFGESDVVTWNETATFDIGTSAGINLTATGNSWTYTGSDPLSSPFIVILKASSEYSAYLFKNLADITSGEGGSFLISFLNNGGQTPGLSHISIYTTGSTIPDISIFGNPVPLPAALWLFAPALLGFMGFRRKSKA